MAETLPFHRRRDFRAKSPREYASHKIPSTTSEIANTSLLRTCLRRNSSARGSISIPKLSPCFSSPTRETCFVITDLGPRLARFLLGEVSLSHGKDDIIGSWLLYNSRAIKSNENLPLVSSSSSSRLTSNGILLYLRIRSERWSYERHLRLDRTRVISISANVIYLTSTIFWLFFYRNINNNVKWINRSF